jgi:nicotinate dehydrogenase subunit B
VSTLSIRDGVIVGENSRELAFGSLVGGRVLSLKLDQNAPLKSPSNFKLVGKPVHRLDIPHKVTGGFTFMQDFKRPGMPKRPRTAASILHPCTEVAISERRIRRDLPITY